MHSTNSIVPSHYLLRPFTQVVLYQPPKPRVAAPAQVWLPMLTDEEERNIRALLKQPINIQFLGCSLSCSIALNELYSELNEFAQNELNINCLEVEFFGPTIWQALGSTYLAHLLSKHNFKVPQKLFPIERHQLPFYVRFCIPDIHTNAWQLLALNRKCFQIIGSRLPQLDQAQIWEGEAVLRHLRIPFRPQSPIDFRITLAEELLSRTCNSLILEFVVPPRSEVQAWSYLSLNKYLSSLEKKEDFSPSPPPLQFTEGGFTVFCQNVMDWLNPATYEPNRKLLYYDSKFTPAMLVDLLAQLPFEWQRQASSPKARQALLAHLEKNLAKLLQTSPLEKQTAFACFTQEIFQKPASNQQYWLEILTSSHHSELNNFACEWANSQIGNTLGRRFIQQLFVRFFTHSRRAVFAVYLCGILGGEAAVAQLGEVSKSAKYQKRLKFFLFQLSKNKERVLMFLNSAMKANLPMVAEACLFLCKSLKVRNLPLAIAVWVKATEAGIWVSEAHRKQQVDLLATLSITVENKEEVEQLLQATDTMHVAPAQKDQFTTTCAALQRRINDKAWYTEQEELIVKAYEKASKPPVELIRTSSILIRRLSDTTFSKDLPLEAIYMAKKILINPVMIKLFFESGEEERWHDLLLCVAEKAAKIKSEDNDTFLCSLLLRGLDQLYAAKLPYPTSKRTLQRYHVFFDHLLSLRLGQRATKNIQGNLAERLWLYIMSILPEYQSHELFEEGCQLLTRISIHKKLAHPQKFFVISCFRFLIEGVRKRSDSLAALVDVENLLEKLPFLRKGSSNAKFIRKQEELCFLLAKGFLEFNEEKSWQFFERLVSCYPTVLIEPELHHEVMNLAKELYGKKGFPVLDLLLNASQKRKSPQTAVHWRGLFVAVFDHLLVNDRLEDLYKMLKEGYHVVPSELLEKYAAIWVQTVLLYREIAAFQPTIKQISEILRLYPNKTTSREWVQFLREAKECAEIDLWQELQFTDKIDVQERRLIWAFVLDRMKGRQLVECLAHTETLLIVFDREVDFFIKLMWAVLKHLSRESEEYKREKGPLLSKLCSGVVQFSSTIQFTKEQHANLGILQIESNLLKQAVLSDIQLKNLILFFKNFLSNKGITKEHFWFTDVFLRRIAQRIINQKKMSEFYNDIANNFLIVLINLNSQDLPSYKRIDYLTELLPLVAKDQSFSHIYLKMWSSLYAKCEEEAHLGINQTAKHQTARSRFFDNLGQFFSTSQDLLIFPDMYQTLSSIKARLIFTARQHADLLAEIGIGLLQTTGKCVEESILANAQNIFLIHKFSSSDKSTVFHKALFIFHIKLVKNDASAFFKKLNTLINKCKNNEYIREEFPDFHDYNNDFQATVIYFLLSYLDYIPPNSQMKALQESQNKFRDLLGQLTHKRFGDIWRATLVTLVLQMAKRQEKESAAFDSMQFLEEMQARYQLFSQENEEELLSLYIDLFKINIHIPIPLEKFSLQTLSLKFRDLIVCPGLQQKFSVEERLTAIIKLLETSGKSLLDKVSADGDRNSLKHLIESYTFLFLHLYDNYSSPKLMQMMSGHLYNLFNYINDQRKQKKQEGKDIFAPFIIELSKELFCIYHSKRDEKTSGYHRGEKMPQDLKRELNDLATGLIEAVEWLLPFVLERIQHEPAEEQSNYFKGLKERLQILLVQEYWDFYSLYPSKEKILEKRVQAILVKAEKMGIHITFESVPELLAMGKKLFKN